jgi:hypothetical protein
MDIAPQERAPTTERESDALESPEARALALLHGGFLMAAGAWPVASIRSFEWVTGPKSDKWLVKTVGTLIAIAGGVVVSSARRDRLTPEVVALANGISGALGYISFHYARKRRISRIYYLDTVMEAAIIGAWARTLVRWSHPANPAATPAPAMPGPLSRRL